ncbi:hypothetical protein AgCh_024450 [Apium graveolens]
MEKNPKSFGASDRKTIEKNRRNYMKDLYCQLHSLIPNDISSKGGKSLTDQLDAAAKYIRKLKIKLEKLKQKRETLEGINLLNNIPRVEEAILESACVPPQVDIHDSGYFIEIHLVGADCVSTCGSGTISERIKKFVNGGR